jgi:hypothetical protein
MEDLSLKDQPGLIYPQDKYAMKQEDGSWRCGPCIYEDSKRKIRVLRKDDHEVKGMITEK